MVVIAWPARIRHFCIAYLSCSDNSVSGARHSEAAIRYGRCINIRKVRYHQCIEARGVCSMVGHELSSEAWGSVDLRCPCDEAAPPGDVFECCLLANRELLVRGKTFRRIGGRLSCHSTNFASSAVSSSRERSGFVASRSCMCVASVQNARLCTRGSSLREARYCLLFVLGGRLGCATVIPGPRRPNEGLPVVMLAHVSRHTRLHQVLRRTSGGMTALLPTVEVSYSRCKPTALAILMVAPIIACASFGRFNQCK